MLFTRLRILTQDQYANILRRAGKRCECIAKMCVLLLDTCDPMLRPSHVANGLLVHSLVAVRLFPLELLQPLCIDFQQWKVVFVASRPEGQRATLPCMLPHYCINVFVQQVHASTGIDRDVLREDSYHMATFMRDAFQALRTRDNLYTR